MNMYVHTFYYFSIYLYDTSLVYAHANCLTSIRESNIPESLAVTMETTSKILVSKKYLAFLADLLTLKVNIKYSKQLK